MVSEAIADTLAAVLEVIGPTLTLTPVGPEHVPGLFVLGSDPEVTQWFSWGPYVSEDQPREWVRESQEAAERGDRLALAILRDGEVCGMTELNELSVRDHRAMIGTWLGRAAWGTGVNTESKALVLQLAFTALGLRRVGAYANPANGRSNRALEKVGFVREGTLRGWHRHGERYLDVHMYSVLAADWAPSVDAEVRGEAPAAWVMPGATPS